jgi:hypothetical protein
MVITPTVRLTDPYVILDYGDRYLDVQDHLTHCVSIDLWCDLRVHTIQPAHNILVFEEPKYLTVATLYLHKYDTFTFTLVDI